MNLEKQEKITEISSNIDNVNSHAQTINKIQHRHTAIEWVLNTKDESDEDIKNTAIAQTKESGDLFESLDANNDALQSMLAAQIISVHNLQQETYMLAKRHIKSPSFSYYINTVTKLSNVFIQQASTLQKLQGKNHQKVRVEHVNVHNGGQAIVGNIETHTGGAKK